MEEETPFSQWEAGTLSDRQALQAIWSDLREVESQIAPLEAERARLREQMSQIVARTGSIAMPGFGAAQITAPSRTISYDARQVSALIGEIAEAYPEIAERLRQAQRVSERSGGLRIAPEKPESAR
jgi:hypothetical protein